MAKNMTVAEYLSKAIELSGKTQREIAAAVGYSKPNIVSMMRLGHVKVPINKIPAFATTLGLDPAHFTRLAMREYMPEVWAVLGEVFGESTTNREKQLLELLREEDPDAQIMLDTTCLTKLRDTLRACAEPTA
jgi:hypothetical protein